MSRTFTILTAIGAIYAPIAHAAALPEALPIPNADAEAQVGLPLPPTLSVTSNIASAISSATSDLSGTHPGISIPSIRTPSPSPLAFQPGGPNIPVSSPSIPVPLASIPTAPGLPTFPSNVPAIPTPAVPTTSSPVPINLAGVSQAVADLENAISEVFASILAACGLGSPYATPTLPLAPPVSQATPLGSPAVPVPLGISTIQPPQPPKATSLPAAGSGAAGAPWPSASAGAGASAGVSVAAAAAPTSAGRGPSTAPGAGPIPSPGFFSGGGIIPPLPSVPMPEPATSLVPVPTLNPNGALGIATTLLTSTTTRITQVISPLPGVLSAAAAASQLTSATKGVAVPTPGLPASVPLAAEPSPSVSAGASASVTATAMVVAAGIVPSPIDVRAREVDGDENVEMMRTLLDALRVVRVEQGEDGEKQVRGRGESAEQEQERVVEGGEKMEFQGGEKRGVGEADQEGGSEDEENMEAREGMGEKRSLEESV